MPGRRSNLEASNEFDGIRPYRDEEVPAVIARLLQDTDFLDFLGRYDSPRLARLAPGLVRFVARRRLSRLVGGINTIDDFQEIVAIYARKLIKQTMTSFDYEGVDRLKADTAYLFVSNHRDIAGDSMLVDYALHISGLPTVRIAVGDNLVQREFATDIMKLNKSFFIRRSEVGARKIFAALNMSSRYIHETLRQGESIWIAQAEGRAKDCMDETDPALVKMFVLAERKRDFTEVIESLNIVPVAISYEFDPCDELKAKELHAVETAGGYTKPPGEDLRSLVKGLGGFKGRVIVRFGEPLEPGLENPEEVAAAIDRHVLENLQLFPVNFHALRLLAARDAASDYGRLWGGIAEKVDAADDARFTARLEACPAEWRHALLTMYANPVLNKARHGLAVVPVAGYS